MEPLPPHTGLPWPLAKLRFALLRFRGARATLPTGCKEGWVRLTAGPYPALTAGLTQTQVRPRPLSPKLTTLSSLKTWKERDIGETWGRLTFLAELWWRGQVGETGPGSLPMTL